MDTTTSTLRMKGNFDLVKVCNIVVQDPVAIREWNTVKHAFVKDHVRLHQIQQLIVIPNIRGAILLTLQFWITEIPNARWGNFIKILQEHSLNGLAVDILEQSNNLLRVSSLTTPLLPAEDECMARERTATVRDENEECQENVPLTTLPVVDVAVENRNCDKCSKKDVPVSYYKKAFWGTFVILACVTLAAIILLVIVIKCKQAPAIPDDLVYMVHSIQHGDIPTAINEWERLQGSPYPKFPPTPGQIKSIATQLCTNKQYFFNILKFVSGLSVDHGMEYRRAFYEAIVEAVAVNTEFTDENEMFVLGWNIVNYVGVQFCATLRLPKAVKTMTSGKPFRLASFNFPSRFVIPRYAGHDNAIIEIASDYPEGDTYFYGKGLWLLEYVSSNQAFRIKHATSVVIPSFSGSYIKVEQNDNSNLHLKRLNATDSDLLGFFELSLDNESLLIKSKVSNSFVHVQEISKQGMFMSKVVPNRVGTLTIEYGGPNENHDFHIAKFVVCYERNACEKLYG